MHYYDYPMMVGYGSAWGFVMMLAWLFFFVVIAVVAVRLIKVGGMSHHGEDPVDIAKERYAKGEITKQEFEQLKKDLK